MFDLTRLPNWLLVVAIVIPLVLLYAVAIIEIVARRDLSFIRKVMWGAVVVVAPYVGIAVYYIARPLQPPEGKRYGETASRSSAIVTQLEDLAESQETSPLPDDEYLRRKRQLLGLADAPS